MKSKRKIKIYFSMDPDLHEVFEKHIDANLYDKSKLIERLIEEYSEKNQLIKKILKNNKLFIKKEYK
jgi:hypothetical protein